MSGRQRKVIYHDAVGVAGDAWLRLDANTEQEPGDTTHVGIAAVKSGRHDRLSAVDECNRGNKRVLNFDEETFFAASHNTNDSHSRSRYEQTKPIHTHVNIYDSDVSVREWWHPTEIN